MYAPLARNALRFYLAQRDGADVDPSVLDRQPSHLTDAHATAYLPPTYSGYHLVGGLTPVGGPSVNVEGGWFDAGDYLKFVQTASYTDAVLLMAARDNGTALAESRTAPTGWRGCGTTQTRTLYYQVGVGDGNRDIVSDHDVWRLPQADDALNVSPGDPEYYLKYRPVFRAGPPGSPVSPNLAGRLAADFGLCYQVWHLTDRAYADRCLLAGEHVLALAKTTHVGQLLTASPHGYYPEREWHSDMELGATELARALELGDAPAGLPVTDPDTYLRQAGHWAQALPEQRPERRRLPEPLRRQRACPLRARAGDRGGGHAGDARRSPAPSWWPTSGPSSRPARHAPPTTRSGSGWATAAVTRPRTRSATPSPPASTSSSPAASSTPTFGQQQLDWVLGDNAWGSSFIVGAGSTFPNCMQSQVANLVGSLDGTAPLMLGATVDGPESKGDFSGLGIPAGALRCPVVPGNPFKPYDGRGDRYLDNVISWPSVEPTDDYTVLGLLLFARLS